MFWPTRAAHVVTVWPDTRLAYVTALFDTRRIASVVVVDRSRPAAVGIVTDRELVRALARHGVGALDMRAGQVMLSPALACGPDDIGRRGAAADDR